MTRPPPPPGRERRVHERHDILAQLELHHRADVWIVRVANISAGGLFVDVERRQLAGMHVGDAVNVFLDLGNDTTGAPLALRTTADIVRVDYGGPDRSAGLGLMWTARESAVVETLARILRHVEHAHA